MLFGRFGVLPKAAKLCSRCQGSTLRCGAAASTGRERAVVTLASAGKGGRQRLDDACCAQHPELERSAIQSWIAQGKVTVDQRVVTKSGTPVKAGSRILLAAKPEKFVCRAGYKLEAGLDHFRLDVTGTRALDAGISTGGFTDCLLQRNVAHVVGVDVGYGQVAERVRTDPRVTVMERTNLRRLLLGDLPNGAPVDIATLDLSFIGLAAVLPGVRDLLAPAADLVVLIKPQFEAARHQVEPGGVVKDPTVHAEVVLRVRDSAAALGLEFRGCMTSPLSGAVGGNTEFLAHFARGGGCCAQRG